MNVFVTLFNRYSVELARRMERSRQRRQLLEKSERQLADMGFSRELLSEGIRAWPWQTLSEDDELELRRLRLMASVAQPRLVNGSKAQNDAESKAVNVGRGDSGGRDRQRSVETETCDSVA